MNPHTKQGLTSLKSASGAHPCYGVGVKKLFNQGGFSLPEMVIVIVVFALIIVVVYSIYTLSQRAYLEGENAAEIIQNGRVILERMSREIRQAREMITELPEEKLNPPGEIVFHDGHLSPISEDSTALGGSDRTITLALSARGEDDYYKDMFIKITGGTGIGQIRKIDSYDGATKIAGVDKDWDTNPVSGSSYKIDTSYYYIHYYLVASNNEYNIQREVFTYCFSEDGTTCINPETYVFWNATPPTGQEIIPVGLEESRIIGEYVTNLEFWGSRLINISLTLEKKNKSIELETKIFGRNL